MKVIHPIILASASPRRRQLLEDLGLSFEIIPANTGEEYPKSLSVEEIPVYIAEEKANSLGNQLKKGKVVIAADTIVVSGSEILGKPADTEDAIRILKALSGKEHAVITGVSVQAEEWKENFFEKTIVKFHPLSDDQIKYYVNHYKPFDKAGAYAIQEWIGMVGIKGIEGDIYNVIGLPVAPLVKILLKRGVITF
jgi:septum formation protein